MEQRSDSGETPSSPLEPLIRSVVLQLITTLAARELLEVQDSNRDGLAKELAVCASESDTFTKLSAKLTKCLVNSDHVDEVYGTDHDLEEVFDQVLSAYKA